jgi:hypothetical protein
MASSDSTRNELGDDSFSNLPFEGDDRRRHGRVGFSTRAWVHELQPGCAPDAGQLADAADLSRSGMGVRSRRMYYVGRTVIVMLMLPTGERKFMCGVVRSSRYTVAGMYHVGIEFCPMPAGEHINEWMRTRSNAA